MVKYSLFFILISLLVLGMVSCDELRPNPADMVGHFSVSASFNDTGFNEKGIKDSILNVVQNAKEEIATARNKMNQELNLTDIDTMTVEGKIEYAAKKFALSIGDIGLNLGEMGNDAGSLFGNIATGGIGFAESVLKSLSLDIELKADGEIRTKESYVNLGLNDAKWEVRSDKFLVHYSENKRTDTLLIREHSSNGFKLKRDNLLLEFKKTQ
jgi:hypothetical protein